MALETHGITVLSSGQELALQVHEIVGAQDGPTFGISSGVHGDEFNGPEIVYHFLKGLNPNDLRGRLLVCPIANPLSYATVTRFTTQDGVNLNRVMPGNAAGTLTEMMADVLAHKFLDRLDAYVDVHSGGAYPTVDYTYILNAEPLSRAAGFPVLYRPVRDYEGTTTQYTVARGLPSVVLEIGGGAVAQDAYVERGVLGLRNILKAHGMLPGQVSQPPKQVVVRRIDILRPKHGGLLIPEVRTLGNVVPRGTLLARVVSPYTLETLEEMRTTLDQSLMILAHLRANKVDAGDYGYMLGDMSTAEPD